MTISKPPFDLEKDTLHDFSMHQIRVPTAAVDKAAKEKKIGALKALAFWIDGLVNETAGNHMAFQRIVFPNESWWIPALHHEFHLRVYYSHVTGFNQIGEFLASVGAVGNFQKQSIHYLFFFYREVFKTSQVGKSIVEVPDYEIFVLTTGQAWQVLKRRNYQFPIQVFKRIASSAHIKAQTAHNLTGPTLTSSALYRRSLPPSMTDHLYHVITRIKSLMKKKAYLRSQEPLVTSRGPTQAEITVELGVGSLKLGRKLPLPGYARFFDYCSQVCTGEQFYCLEDSGKKLSSEELEEDDPGFDFLDFVHPVEDELVSRLEETKRDLIWEMFQDNSGGYLHFSHKYAVDFFSSPIIPTFNGRKLLSEPGSWNHPPSLEEVFALLRGIPELKGVTDQQAFFEVLKRCQIAFFRGGSLQVFPLLECIEGEIKTQEGETYFYVTGSWQQASIEYHTFLQRDFNALLEDHLDPKGLPLTWMRYEKWAAFSLGDLQEKVSNKSDASRVLQALLERGFCEKIDGSHYLMVKMVGLSRMRLSSEDQAALEAFLKERFDLRQTAMNEGPYNEMYLYDQRNDGVFFGPDEGWLVGDRIDHTARKIEIFDVVRYDQETCELFHVKDGLGGTTRIACSQIRNAAKQLEQVYLGHASSDVIEEFWAEVRDSKADGYREKLKAQLEDLGKDAFQAIFNRPNIVFVFAFLDSEGETERLLESERTQLQNVTFVKGDFESPSCLKYRNKPNTTSDEILQLLERQGYLKGGKATDKLLVATNATFFLDPKLGKTTQHRAIYRILMQKLSPFISQFDSTIAKVELLTIRDELREMGFGFKICQIRRPPGAKGFGKVKANMSIHSTSTTGTSSSRTVPKRRFSFEGTQYERQKTREKGTCGLHAILGVQIGGEYCYPRGANPDFQAKHDFLMALRETENQEVLDLHANNFSALLTEAQKAEGREIVEQIFFHGSPAQAKYLAWIIHDSSLEEQIETLKEQEGAIWRQLMDQDVLGLTIRTALLAINEGATGVSPLALFYLVGEDRDTLEALLPQEAEGALGELLAQRLEARQNTLLRQAEREQRRAAFLEEPEVWEGYVRRFREPGYYLNSQEIHMAACLNNKWVTLLHYNPNMVVERSEHDFNPGPDRDHVTVFHEWAHFERCHSIQE